MTDSPTRLWWFKKLSEKPCGAYFFAFFEKFVAPILTSGGLAAVSSSFFAALYSAFGRYDVVHIHAEGPAFFCWIPKLFGKRVISTIHGLDWAREKWKFGVGSKFIRQGEKNAVKYADEIIVLSKDVQKYFMETYGRVQLLSSAERCSRMPGIRSKSWTPSISKNPFVRMTFIIKTLQPFTLALIGRTCSPRTTSSTRPTRTCGDFLI